MQPVSLEKNKFKNCIIKIKIDLVSLYDYTSLQHLRYQYQTDFLCLNCTINYIFIIFFKHRILFQVLFAHLQAKHYYYIFICQLCLHLLSFKKTRSHNQNKMVFELFFVIFRQTLCLLSYRFFIHYFLQNVGYI